MNQILKNSKIFSKRTILTMHNNTVANLNDMILNFLSKNTHIMMFVNSIVDEFQIDEIFIEYLRILKNFSLFFAILRLKIEIFVMLLRNLCSKKNFCNKIRLIVTNFRRFVLKIRILKKFINDQIQFISKIAIHSFFENLFWIIQRKQFFIRLCFAMIVNKSQNQSLNTINVNLRRSVFFHEQLYIALFWITNINEFFILLFENNNCKTQNVIYSEILLH